MDRSEVGPRVPFTLENILAAYRATRAEPEAGMFWLPASEGSCPACGCPVGVFAVHFHGFDAGRDDLRFEDFADVLGVSELVIRSFTSGFDNGPGCMEPGEDPDAYALGCEARAVLLPNAD